MRDEIRGADALLRARPGKIAIDCERKVGMAVITISRQLGSLGCQIVEEIAACLNYRVIWREVINEAASRAGVPEVALATIDELDLLGIRPSSDDRKAYHNAVREIMKELASEGNVVILGRAGQVILSGVPDVLHIRIYAPFDLRVERIAVRHELSMDVARAQVEASDQTRTRYLKRYYNARWDDPALYDLMINTGNLDANTAAAVVCATVKMRMKKPPVG
jgi:cytidylate kinase